METIRFKKSDWVIIAIVVLMIVTIAIMAINDSKKEDRDEIKELEKERKKNRLIRFIHRWSELIDQISMELKDLQLTKEMEAILERKIANYTKIAIGIFIMAFLAFAFLFYANGIDLVTSLLNTAGILSILFFGGSLLIANRFTEANAVLNSFIRWVRNTVYKKYNYDPRLIPVLEKSISLKELEAEKVNAQIQKLILSTK